MWGAIGIAVLLAGAAPYAAEGLRPTPLFATPHKAAYCYVDGAGATDASPRLFCWTPKSGLGVSLLYRGDAPTARYYTKRTQQPDEYGRLVGWRPPALVLPFGQRLQLRCLDPTDSATCEVGLRGGVLAFTCSSRRDGLICMNFFSHGFRLGRQGGLVRW